MTGPRTAQLRSLGCARKEIRELLGDLEKRGGWEGRLAKGGHIRLYHQNGGHITLPGTPRGGRRSMENTVADIRRIERGVLK